jgi:hypothetical protein
MTQYSSYAALHSFLGNPHAGTRVTTVQRHRNGFFPCHDEAQTESRRQIVTQLFRRDLLIRETGNVAP